MTYDGIIDRFIAGTPALDSAVAEERRRAEALLAKLDAATPAQHVVMIRNREEQWSQWLVEGLLERSRGARFQDPHRSLHLARLASSVASRIGPDELAMEALAEVANGYRITGDMEQAGVVWASVDRLFPRCGTDPITEASILSLRASFDHYVRRYEDAKDHLRQAINLFREYGPQGLLVRALIKLGRILVDSESASEASGVLMEAARLMVDGEESWDSGTRLLLVHNWALALTEQGELVLAETVLDQAASLYRSAEMPTVCLRRDWLQGRLRLRQGRFVEAEEILRSAMLRFAEANLVYEWALAGLDLVENLARQGRFVELRSTAAELVIAFRAAGVGSEAMVSLAVLRQADHLQTTLSAVQALAAVLRRPA